MIDFFSKTRDERLESWGFNRDFKPTSELDLDDIAEITLLEQPIEPCYPPYFLTILMKDGRILKRSCSPTDAYCIRNGIPELENKFSAGGLRAKVFLRDSSGSRPNEVWNKETVLQIIRNSVYEYPLGFTGRIGSNIDKIKTDIEIRFLGDGNRSWWNASKDFCMRMSYEDYVNRLLNNFSFFIPTFTEAGFTSDEIRIAAKEGRFFLLLSICRMAKLRGSTSTARQLYQEASASDKSRADFLESYKKLEAELYADDIRAFDAYYQSRRDRIRDNGFSVFIRNGLYLNWIAMHPPLYMNRALASYLAEKGELHRFIEMKTEKKSELESSQWQTYKHYLGVLANLTAEGVISRNELDAYSTFPWEDKKDAIESLVKAQLLKDRADWEGVKAEYPSSEESIVMRLLNHGEYGKALRDVHNKYYPGKNTKSSRSG